MKKWLVLILGVAFGALMLAGYAGYSKKAKVPPAPNGIAFPKGYQKWSVVGVAHRRDNNTLRAIIGNRKAIAAIKAGKINPWPDGTKLGKLVWKDSNHKHWPKATVPGKFVHAEFMFKDSKKYKRTYGWGFARWKGMAQKPYGKDANFSQECINCHRPVKYQDWVFTRPAVFPR